MPPERWGPSWELRVLAGVQGTVGVGLLGVLLWFFFPHALLVPVMAVAAAGFVAILVLPSRVLLDPGRGEVAITIACWTRHVPLAQVTRVKEVGFGAEISTGDGWSYGFFTAFAKRRRLVAWLRPRLRTGFEGMETAITRAAAVAREDDQDTPLPGKTGSAGGVLAACLVTGFGLLWLAAALLIQPQTGGSLVRVAAHLLIALSWLVGALIVLIGVVLLGQAWHDRRAAPAS
jgi:hypothetical protein